MSSIETLIRIKKQAQTDDLVRLLDEVADYEKLSKAKAFRDLRTSEVAKKKLPLLAGAYAGEEYSLALLTLAGHVVSHLEGAVPRVLTEPMENLTSRQIIRMELMQKQIIQVTYDSLNTYVHDEEKEHVVAVYTSRRDGGQMAALIVVREGNRYRIYQGYYTEGKEEKAVSELPKQEPYVGEQGDCRVAVNTYSVQGNNGYPFGTVRIKDRLYSIMQPSFDCLWLISESGETTEIRLSMEERNSLNMGKAQVETFADALASIIEHAKEEWNDETVQ